MTRHVLQSIGRVVQPAWQWIARLLRAMRQLFPASHYLLLSLLSMAGLELIFALQQWVFIVSAATVIVVAIGVILVRLEEQGQFSLIHIILPILATTGLSGFAFQSFLNFIYDRFFS